MSHTLRRHVQDDARLAVRQVGLVYLLLWAAAWWALDQGSVVLGPAGGCRLDSLSDLFVWSCAPDGRLGVVADLVNGVLASTVWAPAIVMTGAVQPEVRLAALAVVGLHLVGLPAALLVAIRFGVRVCDRIAGRSPADAPASSPDTAARPDAVASTTAVVTPGAWPVRRPTRPPVTPRSTFGLRQAIPD